MVRRLSAVPLALLAVAACADNPAGTSVPTGREFQLRVGESVAVEGTDLGVRFERVASDSRCPANAICVTLGDAAVVFSVTRGGSPASSLTLHTEPLEDRRATVGDWTLTLTRLDPYPYAGRTIAPSEYQAMLRVDPATGS
jgi:hypothetical protein